MGDYTQPARRFLYNPFVIKARPEDFIVEERAALPLREAGEFRAYRLTKSGWNTLDLVRLLARTCGVSPAAIAYGGKKDRHGVTSQFLTIRDARDFSREERNFRLEFKGFMDRAMGPDLIQANEFRIVLRDLSGAAQQVEGMGRAPKEHGLGEHLGHPGASRSRRPWRACAGLASPIFSMTSVFAATIRKEGSLPRRSCGGITTARSRST